MSKTEPWLIHAGDLLKSPVAPMTLKDVIDAVITYCPEYMHGIAKKRYIRALERAKTALEALPMVS